MIIAFCLYKYFPFGGLQRDFMRIAKCVNSRGHQVRVYTYSWQGDRPENFEIIIVPTHSTTNHGRNKEYYLWVKKHLESHPVDRIVGFNKMPGLDFYYAADVCYAEKVKKEKGFLYRMTPRYKHYFLFEKETFKADSKTKILTLTDKQQIDFINHYQTSKEKFHILPPGIYPDRRFDNHPEGSRKYYREKNGIGDDEYLILQVGSDFRRKGVDRTLLALSALPPLLKEKATLIIVGQDSQRKFKKIAEKNKIIDRVKFFSGRDDIAELMLAADVLIHPAYQEAAGIVLLEAITAGLPVLVSQVCGYAHYIRDADCGVVLSEPFKQEELNNALSLILENDTLRHQWITNARHFSETEDLYSLPERAANIILGEPHD